MKKNLIIKKFNLCYLKSIIKIYYTSFSKENRFCLLNLIYNIIRKRAELLVLKDSTKITAFIYIIHYEDMSFILYLAVDKTKRNLEYGSYLLNWVLDNYKDKTIYLNIDQINSKYEDNNIRIKRLNFYLNNKFYLTDYCSIGTNTTCNILSNKKSFDVDKYIILDKKISKWFFTTVDGVRSNL